MTMKIMSVIDPAIMENKEDSLMKINAMPNNHQKNYAALRFVASNFEYVVVTYQTRNCI